MRSDRSSLLLALILLLALTDRFGKGYAVSDTQVHEVLARLQNEYERAYYAGIVLERKAKAKLNLGGPGSGFTAHDFLREAMSWYEKAEAIRPAGNDDALLRWNACAQIIMRNQLVPRTKEKVKLQLE